MKLKQLIFTLLALLASIGASANEWTDENGTTWIFNVNGKNATLVEEQSTYPEKPCVKGNIPTSLIIPCHLGEYTVTGIATSAFYGCSSVTSVTIPHSVTSIGHYIFNGCSNLETIVVEDGNKKYDSRDNCNAVVETSTNTLVVGCNNTIIPSSVTSIGPYAFYSCGLTSVTIPNHVTDVNSSAFNNNITSVILNSTTITSIFGLKSSINTIILGEDVREIDDGVFQNCTNLTSVSLNNGLKRIGAEAFRGCTNLTTVSIPSSVEYIGNFAFLNCDRLSTVNCSASELQYIGGNILGGTPWFNNQPNGMVYLGNALYKYKGTLPEGTELTIPEGISCIAGTAFNEQSGLKSITIPSSVKGIGHCAFYNCTSLEEINNAEDVMEIGSKAFHNTPWYMSQPDGLVYVGKVAYRYKGEMPENMTLMLRDGTTAIADTAFYNCTNLLSISIPNSVRSIGTQAFSGCSSLTDVTVPGVSMIKDRTFENCSSLSEVTLQEGVTSIGNYAFSGCSNLTEINWPSSIKRIGSNVFSHCSSLVSMTFPEGLISLGYEVLEYCTNLESVSFPSTYGFGANGNNNSPFRGIESGFFKGISKLKRVYIHSRRLLNCMNMFGQIGSNFDIMSFTWYVPKGMREAYYKYSISWCSSKTQGVVEMGEDTDIIEFKDKETERICLNNWDANHSDTLDKEEAAEVLDFYSGTFSNSTITSFDELEYFTGLTQIRDNAFSGCSSLTSVTIPEGVTSIGDNSFYGCTELTNITQPESVFSIGDNALENTAWFESQPEGIVYFANVAYNYKGYMPQNTEIVLKEGTLGIASEAFYNSNCMNLTSITIPNSVIYIGSSAFYKYNLSSVSINCPIIPAGLFYGFTKLKRVNMGTGVTVIQNGAFYGCTGLSFVSIPQNVISIGNNAFGGCSGLASVSIPKSVTSLGNYAFSGCENLTAVKVDMATPLSITAYTFPYRSNATLYVPKGCKNVYKGKNIWKDFKNIIEFIEGDVNGDEEIDVLDVVDIVRYVVGTPAETFVPILADINNSGEVNVGDAVALVNEIAGDQNFVKAWRAPQQNSVADDVLTLTSTDNGMSLCMKNERNYTAFQFDLYLPAGTDATGMLLNAQRKQGHLLIYNKVEEGHYRVAAISTSNHTFSGYEGELLAVGLEGIASEDICLRNIRFFTTDGEEHRFDDIVMQSGTTTDIASPQQPSNEEAQDIYDLQGRKMVNGKWLNGKSSKGIYIVNGKKIAF